MSKKDDKFARLTQSMDELMRVAAQNKKAADVAETPAQPISPTEHQEATKALNAHKSAQDSIRRDFNLDAAALKTQLETLIKNPEPFEVLSAVLFGQMTTYMKKVRGARKLEGIDDSVFDVIRLLTAVDTRLSTAFFNELNKIEDQDKRAEVTQVLKSKNVITSNLVLAELKKPFDGKRAALLSDCVLQGIVSQEAILQVLAQADYREVLAPVLGQLIRQGVFEVRRDRDALETLVEAFPVMESNVSDPVATARMLIIVDETLNPLLKDQETIERNITALCALSKNPDAREVLLNELVNSRYSKMDRTNYTNRFQSIFNKEGSEISISFKLNELDKLREKILDNMTNFSSTTLDLVDEARQHLINNNLTAADISYNESNQSNSTPLLSEALGGASISAQTSEKLRDNTPKPPLSQRAKTFWLASFIGFGLTNTNDLDPLTGKPIPSTGQGSSRWGSIIVNPSDGHGNLIKLSEMNDGAIKTYLYQPWANKKGLNNFEPLQISTTTKLNWSRALNPFTILSLGLKMAETTTYRAIWSVMGQQSIGRSIVQALLIGALRIPQVILSPLSGLTSVKGSDESPILALHKDIESSILILRTSEDGLKNNILTLNEEMQKTDSVLFEYSSRLTAAFNKINLTNEGDRKNAAIITSISQSLSENSKLQPKTAEIKQNIKVLKNTLDTRLKNLEHDAVIVQYRSKMNDFTASMDAINEETVLNFMTLKIKANSIVSANPATQFDSDIAQVVLAHKDNNDHHQHLIDLMATRNALIEYQHKLPQTRNDQAAAKALTRKIRSTLTAESAILNPTGVIDMPLEISIAQRLRQAEQNAATENAPPPVEPPVEPISWLNIPGDTRNWRHDRALNEVVFGEININLSSKLIKNLAKQPNVSFDSANSTYHIHDENGTKIADLAIFTNKAGQKQLITHGFTPTMLRELSTEIRPNIKQIKISSTSVQLHREILTELGIKNASKHPYSFIASIKKFTGYITNQLASYIPGTQAYLAKQDDAKQASAQRISNSTVTAAESIQSDAELTATSSVEQTQQRTTQNSIKNTTSSSQASTRPVEQSLTSSRRGTKRGMLDDTTNRTSKRASLGPLVTVIIPTTTLDNNNFDQIQNTLSNLQNKCDDKQYPVKTKVEQDDQGQAKITISLLKPNQNHQALDLVADTLASISSLKTPVSPSPNHGTENDRKLVETTINSRINEALNSKQEIATEEKTQPTAPGGGSNN